ncbi:hypothetical protein, partial [Aeromonas allosaccharophila]|uniref:hypothetical protein n=1 Tax=Aeromonas allosaccharophila TaxID=656 RepID=UPI001ABF380F
CLMFDAASAHTDCLIQIVKERRNSSLLREWNSTQPPSRVKPYFQRLFEVIDDVVCVAACPVDVAHYRDLDHACKGVFELNSHFWFNRSLITQKAHLSCNNTPIWRYRYLYVAWRWEQIKVVAIWSLYIYMHGDRGHAFG